ncbi:MAG: insulinase family protein, partial [Pseudomonadota bacterium]
MTLFTRAICALSLIAAPFALVAPSIAQDAPAPPPTAEIPVPAPRALQAGDETPWLYRGSDVPVDREWLFGEMENGLRYAVRKNGVPPGQVSIRVRLDVGSLHERDFEQGYAHLLEHLLFRE